LMLELLRGTRCVADILADAYTIPARTGARPRPGVVVARACGGCPRCRADGRSPWADPLPTSFPRWPVATWTGEVLGALRRSGRGVAVFYEAIAPHRMPRLLQWMLGQGVRVLVMPSASLVEFGERLHQPTAAEQWVFTYPLEEFRFLTAPPLPSLVYVPTGVPLPSHLRGAFEGRDDGAALRLLLAPSDLPDPDKPHTALRAMLNCATYDFEELSLRIGL
jgi:ATP-dependent DNA helicase RecQ